MRMDMKIAVVSDNQKFLDSINCFKNDKIQCVGYLNAFISIANNPADIVIVDRNGQNKLSKEFLATKIHSFLSIIKYPPPRFIIICNDKSDLSETEALFCETMSIVELKKICKNL